MTDSVHDEVQRVLAEASERDPHTCERLLPLVYDELRNLAHRKLTHEAPGLTLQATALVHEAYLRLWSAAETHWDDRRHFFAAAAEAMRRILVERARKHGRIKHGGGRHRVSLDDVEPEAAIDEPRRLLALDEALRQLEAEDPRRADVVKLRYFCGLTVDQTADLLEIGPATVKRQWAYAQAWLCRTIMTSTHAEDELPARGPSH